MTNLSTPTMIKNDTEEKGKEEEEYIQTPVREEFPQAERKSQVSGMEGSFRAGKLKSQ